MAVVAVGMVVAHDGLNAGGIVHMGNRRQVATHLTDDRQHVLSVDPLPRLATLLTDRRHDQHVWAFAIEFEVLPDLFRGHAWSKRPERLPVLDLKVEIRLHLGTARIPENRPCAEGTQPELHASREVPDDLAFEERPGKNVGALVVAQPPVRIPMSVEVRPDLLIREFRTPVRPPAAAVPAPQA